MTIITPTQLREHFETDLSDAALQRILDSEEAEIVTRYGATSEQALVTLPPYNEILVLPWRASAIDSISEWDDWQNPAVETVLDEDDFRFVPGTRLIFRLGNGTNPSSWWAHRITVVATPADRTAQRKLVLIQLAKLAAQFTGQDRQRIGDFDDQQYHWTEEREKILRSLQSPGAGWFA